jgi:3-oxoacyl-ACP reductase-like protein
MRDITMGITSQIDALIESLTPEQMKALRQVISEPTVRRIESKWAKRRQEINRLYFAAEPAPHMYDGDWKEYDLYRDAIRHEVMRVTYEA